MENNNTKLPFFKRLWNHLKKFHVFMTLFIAVPVLVSLFRYLFDVEYIYNNLYFEGERIHVWHEHFEVTSIEKKIKVLDTTPYHNYQGGTCYKNYYLLCSNNFDTILIYNIEEFKLESVIYTGQTNPEYHCNTCFFGSDFYSASDEFPILYISMENESVRSTIGYRIAYDGGYKIEQITQLYFPHSENEKIYFPNSYLDYETNTLYYGGYTEKSYMQSDTNKLKYFAFPMPDYRIQEVELDMKEAVDTFVLPSQTATQGGFITDGFLYETFSFHEKNNPLKTPKMRVVDLREHQIIIEYDNLGETFGVYDEFENIAIANNGTLVAHGNIGFNLYQFHYTDGETSK